MHWTKKFFLPLAPVALLLGLFTSGIVAEQHLVSPAFASQDLPAVTVEPGPYNDATRYNITEGDCAITWIVYSTDLNRGVIKHSSRCALPLVQQLPFLTRIFATVMERDRDAASFHTLFWGGLVPEQGSSSLEMPLRLALAAHRASGWNAKRGRPASGDVNRFVKDLANSEPIYPELRALFNGFHRDISIISMEKVRVLEAGQLPFYEELKRQGVAAQDKLPFDCMVWFTVSAAID
jgi:hypothetical protein